MKILCFGSCNIDYVYAVDHIVTPGETIAASAVQSHPGGKGLNQAGALARAGADVSFAGCIGDDGEHLVKFMRESGVDTACVRRVEDKTGQAFIQVTPGAENSIIIYHGANYHVTHAYIDEVLRGFSPGDFLILQNEISSIDYLIDKAFSCGLKIVLNPSPFDEKMAGVDLNKITYLLLNEVEAAGYVKTASAEDFMAYMRKHYPTLRVVLTLGSRGCIYFDQTTMYPHPAFAVKAIDTTAAGDTFTGYFVASICRGNPVERAAEFSCAASALAVSREGAASSIPYADDVKEKLPALKPKIGSKRDTMLALIKEYFAQHKNDATLNGLAQALGYSPSYTIRWLKKNMSKTFSVLLMENRCHAAARLLAETDLSVGEIIDLVGYKNESFFRKNFTELYGMTPLQYRKKGE